MSFANDTFTESSDTVLTSHTPDSGGSWTMKWDTTAATVIASEDRVRGDSDSSPSLAYHSADPATAEYDVEATARFVTGSNNGNPAIVGRALVSGSLRNYIFAYLSKQFSSAYLQEVVNGSVSEQGTWSSTFNFDQDYQLKLEIRDGTNLCKLFIDGTQRAQITADVITDKGKAGFSVRLNGRIDNWSATNAASGTDLVVQGSDHSHAADNIALTQAHVLAVADALHAHNADNVVLTQAHALVTQDAAHAHAVDSANLTQAHVLAVADATHGHAADGVTLTQQHALAIADALHAHSAEQPTLSVEGDLIIADVFHTHAADGIVLTQAHVLAVSDALHGHAADGITLTLEGDLVVSDAVHAHLAESLSLTQSHFLIVSDAAHQHLSDVLSLSIPGAGVEESNRVLVVKTAGRTLVLLRASRVLSVAPAARSLSVH